MKRKTPVAVLGATGMVGQQLLVLLENHPWFVVEEVIASPRNAGKVYAGAVDWLLESPMPSVCRKLVIKESRQGITSPLIFSCVSATAAQELERRFAREGHLVLSNASAFRLADDVPLIIPEINHSSLSLIHRQRENGAVGALVTNPNCVVAGLALGLAPLHRKFTVQTVIVATLQAVSGAGTPGPWSLQMVDNLIPWIRGEEEKIAAETSKILETDIPLSASVHRVPVIHGHTMSVFVQTAENVSPRQARDAWRGFAPPDAVSNLPSAPKMPLLYHESPQRPQPRLDRGQGGGMIVTLGRVRPCPVLGLVFELCVHNLIRGAAGAALVNAELCVQQGWSP